MLNTWAVAAAGIVKVPLLKHLPILPLAAKAGVPETVQGDIPKSVVFPFNGHQCIKLIKILSFNHYAKINSMQSSVELYCIVALPAALNLVAYKEPFKFNLSVLVGAVVDVSNDNLLC